MFVWVSAGPVAEVPVGGFSPVVFRRRFEVVGAGWFPAYLPSFVVDFVVAAGAE